MQGGWGARRVTRAITLALALDFVGAFLSIPTPFSSCGRIGSTTRTGPVCLSLYTNDMAAFKVLFLHGKGENGETFQKRLAPIESALRARCPGIVCDFATAPHEIGTGISLAITYLCSCIQRIYTKK